LNASRACPAPIAATSADSAGENTIVSPGLSLRSGLTSADHVASACGSSSVTSIRATAAPCPVARVRVPLRRAGITRVLFRISRSPGRRMSTRSRTRRSSIPLPSASKSRAALRGFTGRVAIRSSGRS